MTQVPPPDDKKETYEYIAVSHRINQDVWHDNFVPKYSAIASAEPTWLFLIGIWMLFGGPMLLFSLMLFQNFTRINSVESLYLYGWQVLSISLFAAILFVQTRRFIQAKCKSKDTLEPDTLQEVD